MAATELEPGYDTDARVALAMGWRKLRNIRGGIIWRDHREYYAALARFSSEKIFVTRLIEHIIKELMKDHTAIMNLVTYQPDYFPDAPYRVHGYGGKTLSLACCAAVLGVTQAATNPTETNSNGNA